MLKVNVIDNHDEALDVWEAQNIRNSTVIHVDAHFDCEPLNKSMHINIGNFLRYAIKRKIINRIIWVVPNSYITHSCCKRFINRQMKYNGKKIKISNWSTSFQVEDVEVSICTLVDLVQCIQKFREPVLLDIDMDYFFQEHLCLDYTCVFNLYQPNCILDFYKHIYPFANLATTITICKSVNGGYTPLRYDYCAEYLSSLFESKSTENFQCLDNLNILGVIKPEIEISQKLLSDTSTRLSIICLLLENGCDDIMRNHVLEILHSEYETKIRYISSIYQVSKIGNKALIKRCLPLAKLIDKNLYASLCMIIENEEGIPTWTRDSSLELKCRIAEYMYRKQKYDILFQILKDIRSSFDNTPEIQPWEGVLSSHLNTYQTSPIRIRMNKLLCITAYRIHENKTAYTISKFLLRYGYGDYAIQTVYNSFINKHIGIKQIYLFCLNCLILFLRQAFKRIQYIYFIWKSGRRPLHMISEGRR